MKSVKREQKYIGFVLGMIVVMLLCFCMIAVMGEPDEGEETPIPGETQTEEVTPAETPEDSPMETTQPPQSQEDTPTPTVTKTPTQTVTNTPRPTVTPPIITDTHTLSPTTPQVSQTPTDGSTPGTSETETLFPSDTEMETETPTPTETVPPPTFTLPPMESGQLLPEYSPQITPGKPAESTEPVVDMHGYVLRIAATWDEYQNASLNTEAIAAFEAKYNCQVLFLTLSKTSLYNRLLMSCATGITYFDGILVEGTELLVNLEPLGLLHAFSDYMTESDLAALPASYQKFLSKDGVLYGIPARAPDVSGIWYNPAVIETYQYTTPLIAYNSGLWNWNEMINLLWEATKDVDFDGYYDTYGIATSSPWFLSVLESIQGSLFRWSGNAFLPGATNPVSLQGLSFVKNIYDNHYVASDYERFFYTGNVPYLAGELSMYSELKSYFKKQELLFLPYPSAEGTAPYTTVATSVPSAAITATAKYPAQTAELLKILYGGDALTQQITKYCEESGFSSQIKTTYLTMLENFTVDYTNTFDPSGVLQAQVLSLLKNGTISEEVVENKIQPLLIQAIAEKSKQVDLKRVPVEIRW